MKKLAYTLVIILALLASMASATEGEMHMEPMSGNAILANAWMHYAEWFVILTAYPAIIMMLFIAVSLHVARPMVVRYLNRMTLRLGADLLWEAWIIGRDVLVLASVAFLGVLILPRLQQEWFTGILVPAFILGIITLVFKLVTDTDANKTRYMVATGLTTLTLIAATLPYAIAPLWHDKGHERFEQEFFIPLTAYDTQQMMVSGEMTQAMTAAIKSVKDAMDHAVEAAEMGDTAEAVAEAQEADTAYHKMEDSLKAWSSTKNEDVEAALTDFAEGAAKGDAAAMKTAREKIHQVLEEFEATL